MRRVEAFFWLCLAAQPALAGHLKYRIDSVDGNTAQTLDMRLAEEWRETPWQAEIHWELLAARGQTAGLPDDRRRLLRLTGALGDDAVQRLDRLSIAYTGERLAARLGRQAVTWGNGLSFHPLDIFSPFAPAAIDKEYKTGDDMLYGQWLLDNGNDLQAVLLPRRTAQSGKLRAQESSLALKYHGSAPGGLDYDLLAARHYGGNVFGMGWSQSLGGAVWRLDACLSGLDNGERALSLATNLDYSWEWLNRNVYGYVEYFAVRQNAQTLRARLARGEIFTPGRDYLSSGMQVELSPLLNLHLSLITDLGGHSGLWQMRAVYDWQQNLQFSAGLELPWANENAQDNARRVYLRLVYYF